MEQINRLLKMQEHLDRCEDELQKLVFKEEVHDMIHEFALRLKHTHETGIIDYEQLILAVKITKFLVEHKELPWIEAELNSFIENVTGEEITEECFETAALLLEKERERVLKENLFEAEQLYEEILEDTGNGQQSIKEDCNENEQVDRDFKKLCIDLSYDPASDELESSADFMSDVVFPELDEKVFLKLVRDTVPRYNLDIETALAVGQEYLLEIEKTILMKLGIADQDMGTYMRGFWHMCESPIASL